MSERYETIDERLSERVWLWRSVIRDSVFSNKIKDQFLSVIEERFGNSKPVNETMDDRIYFSISRLLIVVDKVVKEEKVSREELMPLFENLRDDMWDFYQEINR